MRASITRGVVLLTAVALLPASAPAQQLLHFSLSGTLDSPNGVYPLLDSQFDASFDLSSDPRDLIFGPSGPVAVYALTTYSNGGITVSDSHAYINFLSGPPHDAGGITIWFQQTNSLPNGFGLDIILDAPVLYSGTATEPHFSPGTIDLSGALTRFAVQGAGGPGDSPISSPVLAITVVPEPEPLVLGLLAIALLHRRLLIGGGSADPTRRRG